jgi:hypothetical protein
LDASRMYSHSAYTTLAVALVEGDGKQDVCCLRLAVSNERFIGRALEARIVYVNIGVAVCVADSGRTTPRQFANSIRSELSAVAP